MAAPSIDGVHRSCIGCCLLQPKWAAVEIGRGHDSSRIEHRGDDVVDRMAEQFNSGRNARSCGNYEPMSGMAAGARILSAKTQRAESRRVDR